tara:strand:- start:597 stop:1079 length:483 start_codon:yes stop_codon:yes gene_type:complete
MPQLNQNFTRLNSDTFVLQFIAVDGTLNNASLQYAAWWGLVSGTDPTGTPDLEAWTNNVGSVYGITSYDVGTTYCDTAATPLTVGSTQINAAVGTSTVTIQLNYTNFSALTDGDYYHELVLMKAQNLGGGTRTAYQCRSHVAATGILTVKESLFTNRPYR